jgi:hypothetical protein
MESSQNPTWTSSWNTTGMADPGQGFPVDNNTLLDFNPKDLLNEVFRDNDDINWISVRS